MGVRTIAALGAALALSTGAVASDLHQHLGPSTMFYVSIPLDARSPKEAMPAFGLAIQGRRAYETVRIDSRMFNFLPLGGLEVKWLVVGGVAVAAAVAVGSKDKSREQAYQESQQIQAQQQQQQEQQKSGSCSPTPPAC